MSIKKHQVDGTEILTTDTEDQSLGKTQTADDQPSLEISHDFNSSQGSAVVITGANSGAGTANDERITAVEASVVKKLPSVKYYYGVTYNRLGIKVDNGAWNWSTSFPDSPNDLWYVHGVSNTDLWVCGKAGSNGYIAHDTGSGFVRETSHPLNGVAAKIYSVFAASADEVWTVSLNESSYYWFIHKWTSGGGWVQKYTVDNNVDGLPRRIVKVGDHMAVGGYNSLIYSNDAGETWARDTKTEFGSGYRNDCGTNPVTDRIRVASSTSAGSAVQLWEGFTGGGGADVWTLIGTGISGKVFNQYTGMWTDQYGAAFVLSQVTGNDDLLYNFDTTPASVELGDYSAAIFGLSATEVMFTDNFSTNAFRTWNGVSIVTENAGRPNIRQIFAYEALSGTGTFGVFKAGFSGSSGSNESVAYEVGTGATHAVKAASGKIELDNGVVILGKQSETPATPTNKGVIYTKEVSGETEAFYLGTDGNEIQITSGGKLIAEILKETDGPTNLALGAITDTQFLKRSGSTVVGDSLASLPTTDEKSALAGTNGTPADGNRYVTNDDARNTDSRAPSGSASGDLSGTYPSPTVVKLTIDSAATPETLDLGDVADGEYFKRSGTDVVGDTPAGGGGTTLEFTGDPNDRLAGDEVFRPANFESLESIDFVDPLNSGSVHPNWTEVTGLGTIAEDANKLVISGSAITGWGANTPLVYTVPKPYNFVTKVYVKIVSGNEATQVNLIIYKLGDQTTKLRYFLKYTGTVYQIIWNQTSDNTVEADWGQDYAWLAVARNANSLVLYYSANEYNNEPDLEDMTYVTIQDATTPYSGSVVSLAGIKSTNAVAWEVNFRKFSLKYETVSTRLRGYIGQGIDFHDNLNDSRLHDNWTQDIPNPTGVTIAEDSSKLSITSDGTNILNWWASANYDSPNINMAIEPLDFTVKVHVSNISTTNGHGAGLTLYIDGDKTKFIRIDFRRWADTYFCNKGHNSSSEFASGALGQDNCWVALVRRGYQVLVYYSIDSIDNEPVIDDMDVISGFADGISHESLFSYTKNRLALNAASFIASVPFDIHFNKFSLVYNNVSLYQNESYMVEQMFTTDGTETPGATKVFSLNKQPGGYGIADTPSGYHLLVHRGTLKLDYTGTLSNELEYEYNPATNVVSVQASGDEEKFSVALMEPAPTTQKIQEGSFKWKYLGEDTEIGLSALACYQFDGGAGELNDKTGNGYTLTVESGAAGNSTIGGITGFYFDGSTNLIAPDTDDLRIVGALTMEVVMHLSLKNATFIRCGATGESLETNVLYGFTPQDPEGIYYLHEYGSGSNVTNSFSQPYAYALHYLVLTRDSAGTGIKIYIDGKLVDSWTASNAPAKAGAGNTQRLRIGGDEDQSVFAIGTVSSIRMSNAELTAAQIANVYDQIKTTTIETPVALSLDQQGYTVEDNFSDSSIHERWTVSEPGATTVVEGSDGIVLTNPAGSANDPRFSMSAPSEMNIRNWIFQAHLNLEFESGGGDSMYAGFQISGLGGNVSKYMQVRLRRNGSLNMIEMPDSSGNSDNETITDGNVWLRMRKFGDEIRCDYYNGVHTDDVDGEGHWHEFDSDRTWYATPRSAVYNYPVRYTTLTFVAGQGGSNPGLVATFRHFKLRIF